jgi:hypothetical protein
MNAMSQFGISDSAEMRERIAELRRRVNPYLISGVRIPMKGAYLSDLGYAVEVVQRILRGLVKMGVNFADIEPGHGGGHILRDYVNALALLNHQELGADERFIGFCGAVLHEIGCAVVERYSESKRVVRHAEAGAILLQELFKRDPCGLNEPEQLLIEYAVAAHTHYLKKTTITDEAGMSVDIEPYQDMIGDKPMLWVWLARWVDRLDLSGPCLVGRHYLTLHKPHSDFDGKQFYDASYTAHMRPLLRDQRDDAMTMAEHLRMFASSQTNASPYGKYDFGEMSVMRDRSAHALHMIVRATQSGIRIPDIDIASINGAWTIFLSENIEPDVKAAVAAIDLANQFARLDEAAQSGWANAFLCTMNAYMYWSYRAMDHLDSGPKEFLSLPGIMNDVRGLIRPGKRWVALVEEFQHYLQK